MSAAAVMGQLRSAVHAFAASGHRPREVINHTNQLLTELETDAYATCCYVELDPRTGHALAVRAGHPSPLLRHPDARTETIDLPGGVMLGVQPGAVYPTTALTLDPAASWSSTRTGSSSSPAAKSTRGSRRSATA